MLVQPGSGGKVSTANRQASAPLAGTKPNSRLQSSGFSGHVGNPVILRDDRSHMSVTTSKVVSLF